MRERENSEERIDLAFTLVACRKATDAERTACLDLLDKMKQKYSADTDAAKLLLAYGDAPRSEKLDLSQLAALAQLCGTILASDAAILMY